MLRHHLSTAGRTEFDPPATPIYRYDLAISAVSFDALLVADLLHLVGPRLLSTPGPDAWFRKEHGAEPLDEDASRIVLVLHQRLWGHEPATRMDEVAVRHRLQQRGTSVIIVALDDAPLPEWAQALERYDLAATGVDGVARSVLDAVSAAGGSLRDAVESAVPAGDASTSIWDRPQAFLAQTRAHGALRRELDVLGATVRAHLGDEKARDSAHTVEIHSAPNRVVARVDEAALTFSWIAGRGGAVADGRLLVMEWAGIDEKSRGLAALTAAEPVRECVYRAEAADGLSWCWRADVLNGRAYSSTDLMGDWLSSVESNIGQNPAL